MITIFLWYVSNKLLLLDSHFSVIPPPRALITQTGTPINYSSFLLWRCCVNCVVFFRSLLFSEGIRGKYNNSPIIHGLVNISNEFPDDSYLELAAITSLLLKEQNIQPRPHQVNLETSECNCSEQQKIITSTSVNFFSWNVKFVTKMVDRLGKWFPI